MNGVSVHWFANLFEKQAVGDFAGSFTRSMVLGLMVMVVTVIACSPGSPSAAGSAARPSLLSGHRQPDRALDHRLARHRRPVPAVWAGTAWYTSAFGAHLTWTLPFGVLIMFAVFNRFAPLRGGRARPRRDLVADLPHVVIPDHAAEPDRRRPVRLHALLRRVRPHADDTSGTFNTLPLEIYGMTTNVTTPVLYALGTVTTGVSFLVIALALVSFTWVPAAASVTAATPARRHEHPMRPGSCLGSLGLGPSGHCAPLAAASTAARSIPRPSSPSSARPRATAASTISPAATPRSP